MLFGGKSSVDCGKENLDERSSVNSPVCLLAKCEDAFVSDSIPNNSTCAITASISEDKHLATQLPGEEGRLLHLSSVVLSPTACYAAGSDANVTRSGKGEPLSGDHSADGSEVTPPSGMSSGSEISPVSEMPSSRELSSGMDYDYAEEYDNEPQISGYIVDDSVRGEWKVKQHHSLYDVCRHEQSCFKEKPFPGSSSGFLVCRSDAYPVGELSAEVERAWCRHI